MLFYSLHITHFHVAVFVRTAISLVGLQTSASSCSNHMSTRRKWEMSSVLCGRKITECIAHLEEVMKCVNVQEKLAAINVTDMLNLTDSQLQHRTAECGATQEETQRLVLAVSNLRQCIG